MIKGLFVKLSGWLTYPPIEIPVIPNGQYPSFSSHRSSTVDSRIKAPPITNKSDTFFRQDHLKYSKKNHPITLQLIQIGFKGTVHILGMFNTIVIQIINKLDLSRFYIVI